MIADILVDNGASLNDAIDSLPDAVDNINDGISKKQR